MAQRQQPPNELIAFQVAPVFASPLLVGGFLRIGK